MILLSKLQFLSGNVLPSRVHRSFCQSLQLVTPLIYTLERKLITVPTQESSTFLTSPKLTLCSSRGFWKRKEHVLLLRTHSLHLPPPRNSESSKLMCSHFWLLSQTSCNPFKVEMKILHKRSKTRQGLKIRGNAHFYFQECLLNLDKSYYHQVPFY